MSNHLSSAELHIRDSGIEHSYRHGETLEEIGKRHGLTRERIRQILLRRGVTRFEGGASLRHFVKVSQQRKQRISAAERKEKWAQKWFGCSFSVLQAHGGFSWSYDGYKSFHPHHPPSAYMQQQMNAKRRKIAWKMTFLEWWKIWESSGKWEKRGRGHGYCMMRYGDSGPYEPNNVVIARSTENGSEMQLLRKIKKERA